MHAAAARDRTAQAESTASFRLPQANLLSKGQAYLSSWGPEFCVDSQTSPCSWPLWFHPRQSGRCLLHLLWYFEPRAGEDLRFRCFSAPSCLTPPAVDTAATRQHGVGSLVHSAISHGSTLYLQCLACPLVLLIGSQLPSSSLMSDAASTPTPTSIRHCLSHPDQAVGSTVQQTETVQTVYWMTGLKVAGSNQQLCQVNPTTLILILMKCYSLHNTCVGCQLVRQRCCCCALTGGLHGSSASSASSCHVAQLKEGGGGAEC